MLVQEMKLFNIFLSLYWKSFRLKFISLDAKALGSEDVSICFETILRSEKMVAL